MSCFKEVSTVTKKSDLDLTKHVNYTPGMILGVDDFTQEFAYLAGRDRWLARDALGFGTVSGLKVQVDKDGVKGARVMVLPGVAISPRGQFICVSTAQCAYINEWLAANNEELKKLAKPVITSPPLTSPPLTSPPAIDELTLYVVLCYRDCPVDNVPIPGEPCRSEEELMAASRIKDDFSLEMRLKAPKQPEEEKVRQYVEWLKHIKIVETGASMPLEDFEKAVLAKWLPPTSPPTIISPPAGELQINVQDVCDYMRTAFRLWVTELRFVVSGRKTGCAVEMTGGESIEDCVLLAELRVPLVSVSTGLEVRDSKVVVIDEEKRPFLLHLRMLQEWMLCNCLNISGTHSPVTSPNLPDLPVSLDDLSDVEVPTPQDGQILVFDGTKWINKDPATGGGVTEHGQLDGLGDDDHEQYLLISGTRAMEGSLDAGGFQIKNVKAAAAEGEAVIFEQAIKRDDEASGDLTGKYPSPTIAKLQGKTLAANPTNGQVLTFRGNRWIAENLPTSGGGVTNHSQLNGLDADDHKQYLHLDGNRPMTGNLNLGNKQITNLAAATGNGQAVNFEQAIKKDDLAAGDITGKYASLTISKLQGKTIEANPTNGQILIFRNNKWIAENLPVQTGGGVSVHGQLTGREADDHVQYLLINGTRAMSDALNMGNKQINNLAAATANNQAVVFQQAIKSGDQAGGDLAGTYPNPTISKLQGKAVKADSPNPGDMLVWNGTSWSPQAQPEIPTPTNVKPELILPLATVTRVDNNTYEIWFNIDAPGNLVRVSGFKESHLRILDETDGPTPFTTAVRCRITPRIRNVFLAGLVLAANQPEPDRMRFNFDIREIVVEVTTAANTVETMPLFDYAEKNNIKFAGFLEGRLATVFVRGTGISG